MAEHTQSASQRINYPARGCNEGSEDIKQLISPTFIPLEPRKIGILVCVPVLERAPVLERTGAHNGELVLTMELVSKVAVTETVLRPQFRPHKAEVVSSQGHPGPSKMLGVGGWHVSCILSFAAPPLHCNH